MKRTLTFTTLFLFVTGGLIWWMIATSKDKPTIPHEESTEGLIVDISANNVVIHTIDHGTLKLASKDMAQWCNAGDSVQVRYIVDGKQHSVNVKSWDRKSHFKSEKRLGWQY